ncbi:hypothetical protein [Aerococcus urinaeequi]|uniref:hypothetical protein n=1 Tax=Aerococcus urinaeequi TaxID=51665 RepID=UPI000845EDCF|nr:hypothetical protein [Aerococcus urinaeequi]
MLSIITTALSVFTFVIVSFMLWFYFKPFFIGIWYIFLAFAALCMIIGAVKEFNAGRSAKDKEKQDL